MRAKSSAAFASASAYALAVASACALVAASASAYAVLAASDFCRAAASRSSCASRAFLSIASRRVAAGSTRQASSGPRDAPITEADGARGSATNPWVVLIPLAPRARSTAAADPPHPMTPAPALPPESPPEH
nr:uncharacterized protein LOC109750600 [Aegilops tauschii subsp. strangulata]